MIDHAAGEMLAASFRRDRDLPDEEGIRVGRRSIAGDPADRLPILFGKDAMIGEMLALQEIAVRRVLIERRTCRDQRRNRRAVSSARGA